MRIERVGIHRVKRRLADGSAVEYHYAWRGGPRIMAKPGTAAYAREWVKLTRGRPDAPGAGTMAELIRLYLKSPAFTGLRSSTKRGYMAAIDTIEGEFYDMPMAAIGERGARRLFVEWRDGFADTPRKADLLMTILARICSYALDLEMIERNPLERVGRLSDGTRRDVIWSDSQIAAFHAHAPAKLSLAMELARWTGQRQGDLLRLTWSAYDGTHVTLKQGKGGRRVRIKVYSELKALLDVTHREAVTILTTTRAAPTPWTADGFRSSWAGVCEAGGISGVTFHDLRGTFVTLAHQKGASIRDIAEITGHSERDAEAIIRKHYLAGNAAIDRLEGREQNGGGP